MASKKAPYDAPPQGTYRDDPDHAETASMTSAVLLDDIEAFPEEELPPYEDNPVLNPTGSTPESPRVPAISSVAEGGDSDYIGYT